MQLKKIIAAGAMGLMMLGSTLAAAVTLADYPAPFVSDGTFDGLIVFGANAKAADVAASVEIAARLGGETTETVPVPGATSTTTASGGAKIYQSSINQLNLEDELGDVKSSFTSNDLPQILKSVTIRTADSENYDYNQYIVLPSAEDKDEVRFSDPVDDSVSPDDEPVLHVALTSGNDAYEYKLIFPTVAKLTFTDTTTGYESWTELLNTKFTIMGKDYTVSSAYVDDDTNAAKITLLGGGTAYSLDHATSGTYTLDGTEYTVTPKIYSDTEVVFTVEYDGTTETTDSMSDGGTYKLDDGTEISVKSIHFSTKETINSNVQFYIGSKKIEIIDTDVTDDSYTTGTVKIGGTTKSEYGVKIKGTISGTEFSLSEIDFKYTPSDEFDITADHEFTDPIFGGFNIALSGIVPDLESDARDYIELSKSGSRDAKLKLTTKGGNQLNSIVFHDENGVMSVSDNQATDVIKYVEGASSIGKGDYIIVSDGSYSHLLEVTKYDDTNNEVTLKDVASGDNIDLSFTESSDFNLILDGKTYVLTDGSSSFTLKNADASGTTADALRVIPLVTEHGAKVYLYDDGVYTTTAANESSDFTAYLPGGNAVVTLTADGSHGCDLTVAGDTIADVNSTTTKYEDVDVGQLVYRVKVTNTANDNCTNVGITFDLETDQADDGDAGASSAITNPSLIVVEEAKENSGPADAIIVQASDTSNEIQIGAPTFTDGSSVDQIGSTDVSAEIDIYGTYVKSDTTNDWFKAWYPDEQATVDVFIGKGMTITTSTSGSTYEKIIPIKEVPVAKLDTEVKSADKINKHLILVGGPCANSLVEELAAKENATVESCADWSTPEGSAIITLVKDAFAEGKYALVVAGTSADGQDTRMAGRVLQRFDDYELTGDSVTVTGTLDAPEIVTG